MGPRSFKLIFFLISLFFAAAIFITPYLSSYGTMTGFDGTPGLMDHWEIWNTKDPLSCFIYSFGDIFCHQQTDRSYIINGSQTAVCVRDIGLILGFLIMSAIVYFRNHIVRADRRTICYIAVSIILIVADWLIQHTFSLNVPETRLITGILAGAAVSLILALYIDRTYDEA